jgi:hypothetical protein
VRQGGLGDGLQLREAEVARQVEFVGQHAANVGVDRGEVGVVREDEHGARGVRTHAGQGAQAFEIVRQAVVVWHTFGTTLEAQRAVVVPETEPGRKHVGQRRGREALEGRKTLEEGRVPGDDARYLRLLQHDLAHKDGVGIGGMAPGQVAAVVRVPFQKQLLQRGQARGRRPARGRARRRRPGRRAARGRRGRREAAPRRPPPGGHSAISSHVP